MYRPKFSEKFHYYIQNFFSRPQLLIKGALQMYFFFILHLQTQSELEDLIHQQTLAQAEAEGMVAECRTAINNEIIKESSKFSFKDIFKIAVACVKIYAAFYTGTVN